MLHTIKTGPMAGSVATVSDSYKGVYLVFSAAH
jgi:hypothetical protein